MGDGADRSFRRERSDHGREWNGENGVARTIHALSARSTLPLVTMNIGGFSENLFESELYGHVKGAFADARTDRLGRFEMADGGAIFLDEIANIPPSLQAALLRILESGEFEPVGSSKNACGRCQSYTRLK